MDKLKRVLSGRDAEEPSGLSEVTLRAAAPAALAGGEGAARCGPDGGWRAAVGGSAAAGGRREALGRTSELPRPLGAGQSAAGPACAASARPWAFGAPGRSRPGAAGEGGFSGAGLSNFCLCLKSPRAVPRRQPLPGKGALAAVFVGGEDSVS